MRWASFSPDDGRNGFQFKELWLLAYGRATALLVTSFARHHSRSGGSYMITTAGDWRRSILERRKLRLLRVKLTAWCTKIWSFFVFLSFPFLGGIYWRTKMRDEIGSLREAPERLNSCD